jgi:hypothetical protein
VVRVVRRVLAHSRRSLLAVCLCVAFILLAATADAARFRLSLRGDDHLLWNTGAAPNCGRSGSGSQDVVFRSARTVTVQIRQVRNRRGKALIFGRRSGGLTISAKGTVVRFDETSGSYFSQSENMCKDIGAKDCGTKPLQGFAPTIFSNRRAGFTLWAADHFYWNTAESPYQNCMALETPTENSEINPPPYGGWHFGNEPPWRDDESTVATRSVAPDALRVGHTYHFKATKLIIVSDRGMHNRYLIQANGGAGSPGTSLEESPGSRLAGDRSISDRINWDIILRRVS